VVAIAGACGERNEWVPAASARYVAAGLMSSSGLRVVSDRAHENRRLIGL
jgi:hypothetical protein